jgi:hypothetical protein
MADALERSIDALEESLAAAAEARGEAEECAERMKQVFSVLVVHYRNEGKGIGECEHQARASTKYKEAADKWVLANYEYRKTDAIAEAKRLRFEAWRTANATERAKMNLR